MCLPWPPSLNQYYRVYQGRIVICRAGRDFITESLEDLKQQVDAGMTRQLGHARVSCYVETHAPRRVTQTWYDLDNRLKATLDVLQRAAIIENDSQIDDLRVVRGSQADPGDPGYVFIYLCELSSHALEWSPRISR